MEIAAITKISSGGKAMRKTVNKISMPLIIYEDEK